MRQDGDLIYPAPAPVPMAAAVLPAPPSRVIRGLPVIDPGSGRDFQQYGQHTAYFCWLHAWPGALLSHWSGAPAVWVGGDAERQLAAVWQASAPVPGPAARSALDRIRAEGSLDTYESACRPEDWRDTELLLMSAWRSGISLVDSMGYLLRDWRRRFAVVFAQRFPAHW